LAAVTTHREVDDIRAEWEDRYGPVPEGAEGLLWVGRLRAECFRTGIRDVQITSSGARLAPLKLKVSETIRLKRLNRDSIYKEDLGQLVLPLKRGVAPAQYLVGLLQELVPELVPAPAG
jgi:transcription-repair coupling factor (superfamily II helicase)